MPAAPALSWRRRPLWEARGAWVQASCCVGRHCAYEAYAAAQLNNCACAPCGGSAMLDGACPCCFFFAKAISSSSSTSPDALLSTSSLCCRHGARLWRATGQLPAALPALAPGKQRDVHGMRIASLLAAAAPPLRKLVSLALSSFTISYQSCSRSHYLPRACHTCKQVRVCNATPVLRLASQAPVTMSPNPAGPADAAAAEGSGSAAASAAASAQPGGTGEEQAAA